MRAPIYKGRENRTDMTAAAIADFIGKKTKSFTQCNTEMLHELFRKIQTIYECNYQPCAF